MGHIAGMDMLSTTIAFIDGLGAPEMMMIFVLVLVLFGGQKLPEFARGLGKTIREFKKAAAGVEDEFKRALEEDERRQNQAKIDTPAVPALNAPASDPAGPEAPVQQYDEYGHEIYDVPATPADSTAPADSTTPATAPDSSATADSGTPIPAAPDATTAEDSSPPPATPAAAPAPPQPPAPASPPASPPPNPPPAASSGTP